MRNAIGDGLFTAHSGEHNWGVAHRVLLPVFGPLRIREMFEEMHEIATQLVMKWARYGSENVINAAGMNSPMHRKHLLSMFRGLHAVDSRFDHSLRDGDQVQLLLQRGHASLSTSYG